MNDSTELTSRVSLFTRNLYLCPPPTSTKSLTTTLSAGDDIAEAVISLLNRTVDDENMTPIHVERRAPIQPKTQCFALTTNLLSKCSSSFHRAPVLLGGRHGMVSISKP